MPHATEAFFKRKKFKNYVVEKEILLLIFCDRKNTFATKML